MTHQFYDASILWHINLWRIKFMMHQFYDTFIAWRIHFMTHLDKVVWRDPKKSPSQWNVYFTITLVGRLLLLNFTKRNSESGTERINVAISTDWLCATKWDILSEENFFRRKIYFVSYTQSSIFGTFLKIQESRDFRYFNCGQAWKWFFSYVFFRGFLTVSLRNRVRWLRLKPKSHFSANALI